jgi:hypothetical protein
MGRLGRHPNHHLQIRGDHAAGPNTRCARITAAGPKDPRAEFVAAGLGQNLETKLAATGPIVRQIGAQSRIKCAKAE